MVLGRGGGGEGWISLLRVAISSSKVAGKGPGPHDRCCAVVQNQYGMGGEGVGRGEGLLWSEEEEGGGGETAPSLVGAEGESKKALACWDSRISAAAQGECRGEGIMY